MIGVRIIPLPTPGEGIELFGWRELPRWSQAQIPFENAPGLLEIVDDLEDPEFASQDGAYQDCVNWAERGQVSSSNSGIIHLEEMGQLAKDPV